MFDIKERQPHFRGISTDCSRRRSKDDIAEDPTSEVNGGDKLVFPNRPYFACSDELRSIFFLKVFEANFFCDLYASWKWRDVV